MPSSFSVYAVHVMWVSLYIPIEDRREGSKDQPLFKTATVVCKKRSAEINERCTPYRTEEKKGRKQKNLQ
ncbi:hypothetical protein Scep_017198 [Stephania cephalantha]|uniref:Uncharacterized protein n=1 Tax=Stephania cephalantha TaxID=152367 RepID=A0AAP0IPL8_9MAGN